MKPKMTKVAQGCPVSAFDPVLPPWEARAQGSSPSSQRLFPGAGGSTPQSTREVGGPLAKITRNPLLAAYEETFRVYPNDAWFDPARSPTNTTRFEIAALKADRGQAILVYDYSVRPYRFSGINSYDFVPLEEARISGSFGYSLQIATGSPGVLRYRMDPVDSALVQERALIANEPKLKPVASMTEADFAHVAANAFAAAAGFGGSLHPQDGRRFGAPNVPFTEPIYDDRVMQIIGVVFRPVESPLAFVEARVSGYVGSVQMIQNWLAQLAESAR